MSSEAVGLSTPVRYQGHRVEVAIALYRLAAGENACTRRSGTINIGDDLFVLLGIL